MDLSKLHLESVNFLDTTLRDGEQTPGASLNPEKKLRIAKRLDELGIQIIEAGSAIASEGEIKTIRLIMKEKLNAEILSFARALKRDINAVLKSDAQGVHLVVSTSPSHLKYKLKKTEEQVLQMAIDTTQYAKDHGLIVELSAEDATRSDLNFVKKVFAAGIDAGADRICPCDTVGILTPERSYSFHHEISSTFNIPVSAHCHNDFGMGVANSIAALMGGAKEVHATINGLGERAGNASLEEIVMTLISLYDVQLPIKTQLFYNTSRLVSRLTGISVQPNKAIIGDNAFTHEAGIHTHGVLASPLTYEPFSPELVGQIRKIIPGKYSGKHGIKAELESLGLYPTDEQLGEIVRQVRALGDKGKIVTDAELIKIAKDFTGQNIDEKKLIELSELSVMTGTNMTSTASVRIILNGKEFSAAETGVGPVDAAVRAIQKITSNLVNVQLKEYRLEALTGGSNAVAEVIVKVKDNLGNTVSARSANEDIVKASVNAMIIGINRILFKKKEGKL
ncbi:2-isopropylmalate synthase [Candidatus Bathyarchaeota archaeon]|nr:2-isopropylmalate synthase [Candidatus Bathyarchaeota archaeon]